MKFQLLKISGFCGRSPPHKTSPSVVWTKAFFSSQIKILPPSASETQVEPEKSQSALNQSETLPSKVLKTRNLVFTAPEPQIASAALWPGSPMNFEPPEAFVFEKALSE
mgnify:CR=1 FL=1